MIRPDVTRILLVGFMASGKSSVGRTLARRLGWRFVDFDDVVAEEAGASIPDIFRARGEEHFRRVEAEVAVRMLRHDRVVLGSGGGWAAVPGRLESLPDGTLSIWLRVGPAEAIRRAGTAAGSRPLLAGPEPAARARELLAEREPLYALAELEVDTEGRTVEDVSADILHRLAPRAP